MPSDTPPTTGPLELRTFEWRGQKRYRCPDCDYDAAAPHDVVRHYTDSHTRQEVMAGPTLFGADDRPLPRTTHDEINHFGSR